MSIWKKIFGSSELTTIKVDQGTPPQPSSTPNRQQSSNQPSQVKTPGRPLPATNTPRPLGNSPRTFIVAAEAQGSRLYKFLAPQLGGMSRSEFKSLMEQRRVLVDGKQRTDAYKLTGGETIVITPTPHNERFKIQDLEAPHDLKLATPSAPAQPTPPQAPPIQVSQTTRPTQGKSTPDIGRGTIFGFFRRWQEAQRLREIEWLAAQAAEQAAQAAEQKELREREIERLTARASDLKEDQQYDLLILHQRGFVRANASGQSITSISGEVENLIRKSIRVVVRPGTYFVSSGTHQNMATTEEYTFTLLPCSTKWLHISAACINAYMRIPGERDRFSGVSKVPDNVARFLEASKGLNSMAIQAGVWTLTDSYSRNEVIQHLVTRDNYGNTSHPITHKDCDKAKSILNRLGIPHKLWYSSVPYEKKTVAGTTGTYTGEFRFGDEHGTGKYTWKDGSSYEGKWWYGEITGHGKYTWANGNCYEGEFKDGEHHGPGKFTWESGNSYEGQWENGRETGGWYHYRSGGKRWCLRDANGNWVNAPPPPPPPPVKPEVAAIRPAAEAPPTRQKTEEPKEPVRKSLYPPKPVFRGLKRR